MSFEAKKPIRRRFSREVREAKLETVIGMIGGRVRVIMCVVMLYKSSINFSFAVSLINDQGTTYAFAVLVSRYRVTESGPLKIRRAGYEETL